MYVKCKNKMSEETKKVYKVTLYMTPPQWERLSEWSAPSAGKGGDEAPWLHLSHECDKHAEHAELLELQKSIKINL